MIRKKTDSGWWEGELQVVRIEISSLLHNIILLNNNLRIVYSGTR